MKKLLTAILASASILAAPPLSAPKDLEAKFNLAFNNFIEMKAPAEWEAMDKSGRKLPSEYDVSFPFRNKLVRAKLYPIGVTETNEMVNLTYWIGQTTVSIHPIRIPTNSFAVDVYYSGGSDVIDNDITDPKVIEKALQVGELVINEILDMQTNRNKIRTSFYPKKAELYFPADDYKSRLKQVKEDLEIEEEIPKLTKIEAPSL